MLSEATEDYLMGSTVTVPKGVTIDPAMPVHPTFLYESIWCFVGLALLAAYIKKRKFNGDIALRYLVWYGAGRFWIELSAPTACCWCRRSACALPSWWRLRPSWAVWHWKFS